MNQSTKLNPADRDALVKRLQVLQATMPDVYAEDIWPEDALLALGEAIALLTAPAEAPHVDGVWCTNLRCSRCYSADTWRASAEAPVAGDGSRFVSISVGGSTHTRTADEWLTLARADLSRQQDARSVREAVIEECAKVCDEWRRTETLEYCCDGAQHNALKSCAALIRSLAAHPSGKSGNALSKLDFLTRKIYGDAHPAEPAGKGE